MELEHVSSVWAAFVAIQIATIAQELEQRCKEDREAKNAAIEYSLLLRCAMMDTADGPALPSTSTPDNTLLVPASIVHDLQQELSTTNTALYDAQAKVCFVYRFLLVCVALKVTRVRMVGMDLCTVETSARGKPRRAPLVAIAYRCADTRTSVRATADARSSSAGPIHARGWARLLNFRLAYDH